MECEIEILLPIEVDVETKEENELAEIKAKIKVKNTGEKGGNASLVATVEGKNGEVISLNSAYLGEIRSGEEKSEVLILNVPCEEGSIAEGYWLRAQGSVGMICNYKVYPLLWVGTQMPEEYRPNVQGISEGRIAEGETIQNNFISSEESYRVSFDLHYAGSDLDLHLYDAQDRHVGINYQTGEVENEIPNATYSGPSSPAEWIEVIRPGRKNFTIKIISVKGNTSYSLIARETPYRPPLLSLYPSFINLSVKAGQKINFSLIVNEYGGQKNLTGLNILYPHLIL